MAAPDLLHYTDTATSFQEFVEQLHRGIIEQTEAARCYILLQEPNCPYLTLLSGDVEKAPVESELEPLPLDHPFLHGLIERQPSSGGVKAVTLSTKQRAEYFKLFPAAGQSMDKAVVFCVVPFDGSPEAQLALWVALEVPTPSVCKATLRELRNEALCNALRRTWTQDHLHGIDAAGVAPLALQEAVAVYLDDFQCWYEKLASGLPSAPAKPNFLCLQLVDPIRQVVCTVQGSGPLEYNQAATHELTSGDIQASVVRSAKPRLIAGGHSSFDRYIFDRYKHERFSRLWIPLWSIPALRWRMPGVTSKGLIQRLKGREDGEVGGYGDPPGASEIAVWEAEAIADGIPTEYIFGTLELVLESWLDGISMCMTTTFTRQHLRRAQTAYCRTRARSRATRR